MTPYIKVAAGIIINNHEEILVARRGPDKDLAGFWEFPGGKIEAGESPQQCLMREIKEELNLDIIIEHHFMDSSYRYPDKNILLMAFFAKTKQTKAIFKDHDEVKWVKINELKNYVFAPADVYIVQSLRTLEHNFIKRLL